MSEFQFPQHIAIIMDGNGRWAKARGLPRTMGHRQGVDAARKVTKAAAELGVRYLTLFGFSTENWGRPIDEVRELMRLLRMYLRSETAELHRSNIRLAVIGNREQLDADIVELIENAERITAKNSGLTVCIALNYGSRHEIMKAAVQWAHYCIAHDIDPDIESAEEFFPLFLETKGIPDPDILIRTSGEQRISNFLLWQCAYTELAFTNTLWPDFDKTDLERAIEDYNRRDRRFGKIEVTSG